MAEQSPITTYRSRLTRLWPWAAAVLTGVLLTLCFPPWNQGWLCWIALTPLLSAVLGAGGVWRKAVLGYVAGLVFFTSTFYWLSTTLAALYANPWLLAITPLIALYFAGYFAAWSWFVGVVLPRLDGARRFGSSLRNLGLAAAGASAWLLHEWLRERVLGGFGWNPLGVALHRDLPMIQIAEFTGASGLSWLVVFVNLMAVIIVRRIAGELGPSFLKRVRWEFSATMALLAGVFTFGVNRLWHSDPGPAVPLRIAAVQPNIPQTEKFDRAAEPKVLAQIEALTNLARDATAPQLILWPEAAQPSGMFASERNYRFVLDQLERADFALLLGTTDFDPRTREDFNTALLLTERGRREQSYRKIHLVPFGEYLPLRPLFGGFVGQLVPSDFAPGHEFTLLALPDPPLQLAALVCFEDTLGDLTRRFVKSGAQVLINLTNDGWFAQSPAAEQHLANAVLRTVENRRPLLRCGNTGVTCAVSPTGHLDRWLPPFTQGFAVQKMRIATQPRVTFYTRHGEWLCAASLGVVLLAGALALRRRA